jgi:hypothetical protein
MRAGETGATPSTAIADSQTVKRRKKGDAGCDAGKKVNGRKHHIVIDTLGSLMVVLVHSANMHCLSSQQRTPTYCEDCLRGQVSGQFC